MQKLRLLNLKLFSLDVIVLSMVSFERFSEYYDLIYQGIVDYEKECEELVTIFGKFSRKKPESILDVGCGTGSHALILSRQGYSVTGIDVSEVMIEKAKEKAAKENSGVEFFVQDMRDIKLDRAFDCAICMFGGFGYVLTREDLVSVFAGLKQHLIKGGLFIFEFWNVGGLKPSPYKSWMKTQNGSLTLYRFSESNFDSQTNILKIDMSFIVISKDKLVETFSEAHQIRCYTLGEIQQYLSNNGFELISAYDWEDKMKMEIPRKETFRILAIGKKI